MDAREGLCFFMTEHRLEFLCGMFAAWLAADDNREYIRVGDRRTGRRMAEAAWDAAKAISEPTQESDFRDGPISLGIEASARFREILKEPQPNRLFEEDGA
jgi:hypothetical protein